MATRDGLGKLKKSAPKIGASLDNLQRVIDTIYKDINDVVDAVNRPDSTSLSPGHKGKSGDIRLYQGAGQDGSIGYFLQGKFEEGWATVHLTLEEKNPENVEVSDPESQSAGPEPFITKYGVNFSNLQVNSTVGENADQVAYGNHQHNHHWGNAYQTGTHLNDIHFPLTASDTDTNSLLDSVSSSSGDSVEAARANHSHRINTGHSFTWTADQTFGSAYGGTTGKTVYINGPATGNNQYALDVKGDVSIDGELLVSYGETQSNAVTLTGDVTMNSDNLSNNNYITYNNKTRIYGPAKFDAGVKISKQSINNNDAWHYDTTADDGKPPFIIENDAAEGQMRLQYDSNNYFDFKIDNSGNLLMDTVGNIQLRPDGKYVLPKGNLETHLGDIDRQWASIHAGELVVQNIMAMNIMSTIGGQLRVAPTSKLSANLSATTTDYIFLKHNDPNFQDAWIFLQKADLNATDEGVGDYSYIDGVVQFEAIRTKAATPISVGNADNPSYAYEIETRNGDGGSANDWVIDDAAVVLYKLATGGSKGFIELTSTGSVFNRYGPRITLFGAKEGDTAWNAAKPIVAIGNLRSYGDYNDSDNNNFGMILSDDATKSTIEMKGMTVDQNDGMRLFNTNLEMYDNGTKKVEILNDGRFRLGSSLTLDNDGEWGSGDNVGLSWNGSQLVINGIVNITGGIYPDGSNIIDLPGTVNGLQQSIDAIDTSDMSDFAAAKAIINNLGDNVIQDWDMEFSPGADSTYNNMTLWGGADNYKDKSSTQVLQGSYSLKIASRHQSNVVSGGTQAHVDAFQTGLDGEQIRIPVVPGMKVTTKFWYHSQWAFGGSPAEGMGRFSVKVYNATGTHKTWVHIAKTSDSTVMDHLWRKAEASYTFPAEISMTDSNNVSSMRKPAYITPFLGTDTWGSASDTNFQNTLHWIYFDQVSMNFDTALAQPASPNGEAGFFAGSDLFGIHDGNNWRIQFAVDNQETSDVGNSYMALRDSAGNRQVSWDGDTFQVNGDVQIDSNAGTIVLADGTLTLSDQGTIKTGSTGFGTDGIYISNNNNFPRLSLTKGSSSLQFNSTDGLSIENADIKLLFDSDVDIFIGKDIATNASTDNNADDIMIGTWDEQTDVNAPASHGILVKHGPNDYSQIYKNGFNRSGLDYPVLVHQGFHFGGPFNHQYDGSMLAYNDGKSTTPANTLARHISNVLSETGQIVYPTWNDPIYGNNISHNFGFNRSLHSYKNARTFVGNQGGVAQYAVPENRKLIWQFTPRGVMTGAQGSGQTTFDDSVFGYSNNSTIGHVTNHYLLPGNLYKNDWVDFISIYGGDSKTTTGSKAVTWDCRYHVHWDHNMCDTDNYGYIGWKKYQWGINAGEATREVYGNSYWTGPFPGSHQYSDTLNDMKYYGAMHLEDYLTVETMPDHPRKKDNNLGSLWVSRGEIGPGSRITNMYLMAACEHRAESGYSNSFIYAGDLKIWETEA